MTRPCPEAFPVTDVEDFASYLGLDGTDADMFYESYYNLDIDGWDWDEENYRNDDKFDNYQTT